MAKYIFMIAFILSCTQSSFAADGMGVDVQQSLNQAFAYSPNLQMMQEAREQATHNERSAQAGYYPTIGIWAGGGITQENNTATRINNKEHDVVGNGNMGLLFSQTIWQGGATSSLVRSREASLEASIFDVLDSSTSLAYNVISSHADVLRRRMLYDLSQYNVSEHEKILKLLRSRAAQGFSSQGDVEQVVSRLNRAKATNSLYREGLEAALSNYKRMTGQHAPEAILPVHSPKQIFEDINIIRNLTIQHNYSLLSLVAQINALVGERDYSRASFSPYVSLDAGPSYTDTARAGDTRQLSWSAMLNMKWNLYNGGADLANFEANSAKVREARKSLHNTMDALDEQISLAFNRTRAAKDNAVYYDNASKASVIARDNFYKQFQAGQKDLLNVLDAETEYFTAASESIIAQTDTVLGQYRMHALAGTLLETVGIDRNVVSKGKPVQADIDMVAPWNFMASPKEVNAITNIKESTLQRN